MTWAEEDNESYQKVMSDRYRKLAKKHDCLVANVGEIWWEKIHDDPTVDLYAKDRRHASKEGSKLVALTIFETLKEKMTKE